MPAPQANGVSDPAGRLRADGWLVLSLPDPEPVFAARDRLLAWLRANGLPALESLETYHAVVSREAHVESIFALSQYFWSEQLGREIIVRNLAPFRELLGPDLHIQRYPYLRAVRPGEPRDAVPLHRDTYYGASPYEVSIVIPFTEMGSAAALRAIRGSHVAPDAAYPFAQHISEDVAPRSAKHQLGFPYAPRLLDPAADALAEPIPLRLGEVALFGLSLVHGGGQNQGPHTRFSTDIRLANSLAPVAWSRGVHGDYFVPLCSSPITEAAQRYQQANSQHRPGEDG